MSPVDSIFKWKEKGYVGDCLSQSGAPGEKAIENVQNLFLIGNAYTFGVFELKIFLSLPCSVWESPFFCEILPSSIWEWGIVKNVQPGREACKGQLFWEDAEGAGRDHLHLSVGNYAFLFFFHYFSGEK